MDRTHALLADLIEALGPKLHGMTDAQLLTIFNQAGAIGAARSSRSSLSGKVVRTIVEIIRCGGLPDDAVNDFADNGDSDWINQIKEALNKGLSPSDAAAEVIKNHAAIDADDNDDTSETSDDDDSDETDDNTADDGDTDEDADPSRFITAAATAAVALTTGTATISIDREAYEFIAYATPRHQLWTYIGDSEEKFQEVIRMLEARKTTAMAEAS